MFDKENARWYEILTIGVSGGLAFYISDLIQYPIETIKVRT